jgi:hypothetical protein
MVNTCQLCRIGIKHANSSISEHCPGGKNNRRFSMLKQTLWDQKRHTNIRIPSQEATRNVDQAHPLQKFQKASEYLARLICVGVSLLRSIGEDWRR